MGNHLQAGVVAEFDTHERIVHAARALRVEGYVKVDAHTPYPMRELEDVIGMRRSPIDWVVFPIGMFGAAAAYVLQWWTSAVDYPLNAGGRPPHAVPAFVPITFEMGVLISALAAVITLAVWSKLPALWQPVFEVQGFDRASMDRFFLWISDEDVAFHPTLTPRLLLELGAIRVEPIGLAGKGAWGGQT